MAANGDQTDFRIPQVPLPVPRDETPGSDEESFVVLGKSIEDHLANMAAHSTQANFRIPQEPLPVPPLIASDEESFDILGQSPEENSSFGRSILQEGIQLIQEELDRIEGNSSQREPPKEQATIHSENRVSTPNQNGHDASLAQSFHSTSGSAMDQSSVLPAMPQPQLFSRTEADDNDLSRTISILSVAQGDFQSEELHLKVTQLIQENIHLKDTMLQNNMSMRAQYEKIVAWQKDVEKVHETHKQQFRQAKLLIETLRKENTQLEQKNKFLEQEITNLRYSLKMQESENNKTQQVLTQSSETNLKQFELDVAHKKVKELEDALEKMKIKSSEDSDNVPAKWRAMEEKLQNYEKELEEAYKKNRDLEKMASSDKSQVYLDQLKLTEDRLRQTEIANEQINMELVSLRHQLAKNLQGSEANAKIQFNHSAELQSELDKAKNKIAQMEEQLVSRNASLIDANVKVNKMEDSLLEANEKIKSMAITVATLQGQLEETKIEVWKNKQKLLEKETQLGVVQKELETTQQQRQFTVASQNTEEIFYLRQQLMQSQMAVTQCEQNRAVAYAQVEKQKNEIAELRRQLETRPNEADSIFAYQAQLDVYKADFEAERKAREDIKIEKDKLSEDLQHLHRRNHQLQEETELLIEQLKEYGSMPRSRFGNSLNQETPPSTTNKNNQPEHQCPKCYFRFRDLNALQNHVIRCIELDESLP